MTLDDFIARAKTWTLFPADILEAAVNDAFFLVFDERAVLAAKLDSIHTACRRIDAERFRRFAAAEQALDDIRRATLPVVYAAVEQSERDQALDDITKQFE